MPDAIDFLAPLGSVVEHDLLYVTKRKGFVPTSETNTQPVLQWRGSLATSKQYFSHLWVLEIELQV